MNRIATSTFRVSLPLSLGIIATLNSALADPKPIDCSKNSQQLATAVAKADPDGYPIGPVEGRLEDLQGRFNLNWLGLLVNNQPNPVAVKAFNQLLTRLQIEPKWTDMIVDWIDQTSSH